MANRIMLNETSYHGAGAVKEIATEAKARAFQKAFICSDPDLIKFGVTKKVTDVLDSENLAYEIYSDIKANPTITRRELIYLLNSTEGSIKHHLSQLTKKGIIKREGSDRTGRWVVNEYPQ